MGRPLYQLSHRSVQIEDALYLNLVVKHADKLPAIKETQLFLECTVTFLIMQVDNQFNSLKIDQVHMIALP